MEIQNDVVDAFEQWLDNPNVLSPATPYLSKKQAFFAGYKASVDKIKDLEEKLKVLEDERDNIQNYVLVPIDKHTYFECLEEKLKVAVEGLELISHECEINVTPDIFIQQFANEALEKIEAK
jgi:hypothetical protein